MTGRLVLVVGPSGSGKDTLLAGAAAALAGEPRFVFARRVVTRAASHEDHEAVTAEAFASQAAAGRFALSWQAHGLGYGIPAETLRALAEGMIVVANVSRAVIAEATARYPVDIVEITAPDDLRAARLAERGRETSADISARLARQMEIPAAAVHRIVNDGTIDEGITALVDLLLSLRRPSPGR